MKDTGNPRVSLRYRPDDPLGKLIAYLPVGANKTEAVNAALALAEDLSDALGDILITAVSGQKHTSDQWQAAHRAMHKYLHLRGQSQ